VRRAELIDRAGFRRLVEVALEASEAEHTLVSLRDCIEGTTHFAENEITSSIDRRRQEVMVTAAFGQQVGMARGEDPSNESFVALVRRATQVAKGSRADSEYLPPLPEQRYPVLPTYRPETAAAGVERRAAEANAAIRLCQEESLAAEGLVTTHVSAVGVAAGSGLFAYEQRTHAGFDLTVTGPDCSGWVGNANRSIDDLGVVERTRIAIDKVHRSASPRQLPPGHYTVILEPAAVAGLVGPLVGALDAKAYHGDTSALHQRLGRQVIDGRLTVRNRPDHPSLLGCGFNESGLPSDARVWIEHGVLRRLDYDRSAAHQHVALPSYHPDALYMSGEQPASESVDELIRTTERGLLVTDLADISQVEAADLKLSGTTRGGTFLVEDGRVVSGVRDLRWRESPLRVFNQVVAFTTPADALTADGRKMFVPAMMMREFSFAGARRVGG
jgi:predicted Zn-dependent protease